MDRSDEFDPAVRDVEHVRSRERPRDVLDGDGTPGAPGDVDSLDRDPEAAKRRPRIRREEDDR
jgi:hypothetical protein